MPSTREPAPGEIRHLKASDARQVPWKNGRGVTAELALWPPGASFERSDFDWRLSCAAVDEPGPFSLFPGFDRVLVITAGAGLQLDHGPQAPPARVPRLQPYSFSGDWSTSARLLDGPVADFNVLARRDAVRASVSVLRLDGQILSEPLAPGHSIAHVLAGEVEARRPDASTKLAAGESLWFIQAGGARPQRIELAGSGELLLVRIESARGSVRI